MSRRVGPAARLRSMARPLVLRDLMQLGARAALYFRSGTRPALHVPRSH